LLSQIIGRGLRLSPETGKEDCLLLDYGQNIDRHGEAEDDLFGQLEDMKVKEKSGDMVKVCPECNNESGFFARRCKHQTGWDGEMCGYGKRHYRPQLLALSA
jgi:DNA repair protein RadD